MWKFFKKFPLHGLQDISVSSDENPSFGCARNRVAALYKLTFV